jgi:hypothetical protein
MEVNHQGEVKLQCISKVGGWGKKFIERTFVNLYVSDHSGNMIESENISRVPLKNYYILYFTTLEKFGCKILKTYPNSPCKK